MVTSLLHQTTYMSRARGSLTRIGAVNLEAIAQARNARLGVTGLLLYNGLHFIQALEGEAAPVREIMQRIAADDRHHSISYLYDGAIRERQFGDWSMRFRRVDSRATSDRLLAEIKQAVEHVRDPGLKAAFIGFAAMGRTLAPRR